MVLQSEVWLVGRFLTYCQVLEPTAFGVFWGEDVQSIQESIAIVDARDDDLAWIASVELATVFFTLEQAFDFSKKRIQPESPQCIVLQSFFLLSDTVGRQRRSRAK